MYSSLSSIHSHLQLYPQNQIKERRKEKKRKSSSSHFFSPLNLFVNQEAYMEGSVEVPSYFLCPISLQIMRDPVTLPTGITYDRHPIERWIFTENHHTCPITNQPLSVPSDSDSLITPNITLRRLIQAWCIANASQGVERFPTPRPPVTKAYISDLIDSSSKSDADSNNSLLKSLRKLKSIVSESERNKRCVQESTEAVDFLASIVEVNSNTSSEEGDQEQVLDEALHILYSLQLREESVVRLLGMKPNFIETTLATVLRRPDYQSRAYAILMLKSLLMVNSPSRMIMSLKEELLVQIVKVLKDKISYQATKAALQVLGIVSSFGRNKVKAVEADAVAVLIELLLDETEKKPCEMMLVVLSRLSECPEGRAEIVGHAAGIAVLSKKLVRVSLAASERAVRIMHAIAKFSPSKAVLKEMLEVGVVSKLCLLVQVDCGEKTKERVKEMLRLHARVWRNSPCISPQLQSSYPSS